MKPKHISAYIDQCLANARLSPCPRRKYGAVAVDPVHNVVITSGYNGTPRGSGHALCGGVFCAREGLPKTRAPAGIGPPRSGTPDVRVHDRGECGVDVVVFSEHGSQVVLHKDHDDSHEVGRSLPNQAADLHPPVKSGTRYEVGCHHAEQNVVANAARMGRSLAGAWVFCSGMPCVGCARLLHHAGVAKVVTIKGGYAGENGAGYLRENRVEVVEVEPPFDLRTELVTLVEELEAEEHDASTADNVAHALRELLALSEQSSGPVVDPGGR